MEKWEPKSFEDKLLYKYWRKNKGLLILEVPIGNQGNKADWPITSKTRRIDAVKVDVLPREFKIYRFKRYGNKEFMAAILNKTIELIEVKKKLNRLVIGQAIAGCDMFERQYRVKKIKPVIICGEGDAALEWVCNKRHIQVQVINLS